MNVCGNALSLHRVVRILKFLRDVATRGVAVCTLLALHNSDGNSSSSHWASINLMIAQSPSVEYHLNS